jgi:hypothetical protein
MSTYSISLFNPSDVYLILNNVNGITYASHTHIFFSLPIDRLRNYNIAAARTKD